MRLIAKAFAFVEDSGIDRSIRSILRLSLIWFVPKHASGDYKPYTIQMKSMISVLFVDRG